MRLLATGAATATAAIAFALAAPAENAARFLAGRETPAGGFAEPGAEATPGLTAWVALGLRAAGRQAGELAATRAYLERSESELRTATDLELALIARAALGDPAPSLA